MPLTLLQRDGFLSGFVLIRNSLFAEFDANQILAVDEMALASQALIVQIFISSNTEAVKSQCIVFGAEVVALEIPLRIK